MTKYYKPNNSTIMYLNSSHNCTKFLSISLTKTSGGTGYTGNPIITITTADGDSGYGATATCFGTGGVISTITMTNNGRNYTIPPIVTLSGATFTTPAVFTATFLRTYNYVWNTPIITVNDLAKLSAINIVANGTVATTPYTYRINGLLYDSRDSCFSDYGSPILSIAQTTNICSYGSVGGANFNIILTQQNIQEINISVDDSIITKGTGQLSTINFIIVIEIEEYDPTVTEIGDPYGESYRIFFKS
jgi:hypothetical protein